jgi:hypothetical protein
MATDAGMPRTNGNLEGDFDTKAVVFEAAVGGSVASPEIGARHFMSPFSNSIVAGRKGSGL